VTSASGRGVGGNPAVARPKGTGRSPQLDRGAEKRQTFSRRQAKFEEQRFRSSGIQDPPVIQHRQEGAWDWEDAHAQKLSEEGEFGIFAWEELCTQVDPVPAISHRHHPPADTWPRFEKQDPSVAQEPGGAQTSKPTAHNDGVVHL
jgi:hypothetical protein